MTKLLVVPLVVLLLTVLHGPTQAQALFFDFLPFSLAASEPITLLLTGVTLLTLARIGAASADGARHPVRDDERRDAGPRTGTVSPASSTRRAA